MKIVHISTHDSGAGAAIAAFRLHKALLNHQFDSTMLVLEKGSSHKQSYPATKRLKKKLLIYGDLLHKKFFVTRYSTSDALYFSPGCFGTDISNHPLVVNADIIHLHWICGGYLSLASLQKLAKLNKKVVWSLHDNWAFTGGCHIRYGCDQYKTGCGSCPLLQSKQKKDPSSRQFRKKQKIYNSFSGLTFCAPSHHLYRAMEASPLIGNHTIRVIPNLLDETVFKPLSQKFARQTLNLNQKKQYICFGAINAVDTDYKGWRELLSALTYLVRAHKEFSKNTELLIFGSELEPDTKLPLPAVSLGHLSDPYSLALVYNAADVFAGPSLEEAFGQTFQESIHCGCPAVAFSGTGTADIIEHKKNGYLAEYKNSEDFGEGLFWCLQNLKKVQPASNTVGSVHIIQTYKQLYTEE